MVNDMNDKPRFLDVFEIICIGLIFSFIPYRLFIDNETLIYILAIITSLIGVIIVIMLIKKRNFIENKETPIIKPWYYLPLLILCVSNYFVLLFQKDIETSNINTKMFILKTILTVIIVILEEILFRYLLMNSLKKKYSLNKTIIYGALIFGGFHILNVSSLSSIPYILIQCVYTAFLGLILGFIYMTSKNVIYPIILHLLFNILNGNLISELFNIRWDLSFYLVNGVIGVLILVYLFIIQKIVIKENTNYVTENMDYWFLFINDVSRNHWSISFILLI